jgi:hypothetical protein
MPNVSTYIPTYISINNLQGGYVAVYDDVGSQYLYRNITDGVIELPYESVGTWTYKIARYGSKLIEGNFSINRDIGGTVAISPTYDQDIYITNTQLSAVSAYTSFTKTSQIYDYLSYYRTTETGLSSGDLNLYSSTLDVGSKNIILFDSAYQPFNYDGSTFVLRSPSLSGAPIKTTGAISLSGTSSISNIELTTNVLDQTPNNLTNVRINGILKYNTDSSSTIIYTNTFVDTVVNDGFGNILITRINSTINNATDPQIQNYSPNIVNVYPDGGSVAIYNNLGIRQYFIITESSVILPFDATGTWSYRVTKYGYYPIYQQFTINEVTGATVNVNPNYISDTFISEPNKNTVSAYTNLDTPDKIHDYLSYYQTLEAGIDFAGIEEESFGTMVFDSSLTLDATAASMVNYSSGILTLKSTSLIGSIVFSVNGNFTQSNGNTISDDIKIRASNIDSEIYFANIDYATLYPDAIDRDNNENGNIVVTTSIYRYKYGSTVSGILLQDDIYLKVNVTGTAILLSHPIATGSTYLDYGSTGNFQIMFTNLDTINEGVKKASILVPHTQNL